MKIQKLIDKLFSCSKDELLDWMELQEEINREIAHYMTATDTRLDALEKPLLLPDDIKPEHASRIVDDGVRPLPEAGRFVCSKCGKKWTVEDLFGPGVVVDNVERMKDWECLVSDGGCGRQSVKWIPEPNADITDYSPESQESILRGLKQKGDIDLGSFAEYANAQGEQGMSGWISVEDRLPETGQMVIATYKNNYGKWRTIVANYTQRWTEPSNDIETDWNDDISEYHEEKDEYFLLAGWYERIENWGDYEFITVGEGTVTHWIPLPEPPKESPDE